MVRDIGARQAADRAQGASQDGPEGGGELRVRLAESEKDRAQAPSHVAQYKRRRECGCRLRVPGFSARRTGPSRPIYLCSARNAAISTPLTRARLPNSCSAGRDVQYAGSSTILPGVPFRSNCLASPCLASGMLRRLNVSLLTS